MLKKVLTSNNKNVQQNELALLDNLRYKVIMQQDSTEHIWEISYNDKEQKKNSGVYEVFFKNVNFHILINVIRGFMVNNIFFILMHYKDIY